MTALTASLNDAFPDHSNGGFALQGDNITYTLTIGATGGTATNVTFNPNSPTNPTSTFTTDVAGSLAASPVGIDDTYPQSVIGNVSINSANIPYSVVTNDYLGLNPTATIDLVQAVSTVVTNTITATTAQGGTVVMTVSGAGMGQFTYIPPPGYEGNDTFTYRLTDNANAASAGSNRTATVTIPISGMVWFINNTAGAGDGRLSSPFNTLAAFQAVNDGVGNHPAANDNIFIYESATAYVGPVTLLNGQKLIGQDATASLATITGLTPPSGSASFPAMNSGNGTIAKITSAANAVNLTNGATSNLIRGLTIGSTTGAGISGTSFGTLAVADTDLSDAGNRTGQALSLTTGTLSATFSAISSTNSAATGITLSGVGGSLTTTTTSITNPAGTGISVGTSSATLSFGDTTSAASGGTGVSLLTNTGTITFGSLNISPDANQRGLLATDNTNTLTATSGAITASGAVALEITRSGGTTSLAILLTSVSANGGASGIVLTNTSGNFTVAGNAGTCSSQATCTGGTIQSTTGIGVSLNNVTNISIDRMFISSTGHSGINGILVNNFSFTNGKIDNSGTVSGSGDSNIAFNNGEFSGNTGVNKNIFGTLTITGNTLNTAFYSGLDVYQFDGTISNANVSNNSLTSSTSTATSKSTAILLQCLGSASTVSSITKGTINTNTIANFPSNAGIFVSGGNATSAGAPAGTYGADSTTNIIAINGNTITGQSAAAGLGTQGIAITLNGRGTGNFSANNNQITNVLGNAIQISAFGNTTLTTFVLANTINAHNINNSQGVGAGTGNTFASSDTPTLNIKIGDGTVGNSNNISNTFGNGILIVARSATGHVNARVLRNTVGTPIENPPSGTVYGIRVDAGNLPSVDDAVDLEISNNTTSGNDDGAGTHAPGIGLRKQGTSSTVNDFGIVGLPGGSTATPNVENYVNSQNPGSASGSFGVGGTVLISATSGFSTGAAMSFLIAAPGGVEKAVSKRIVTTSQASAPAAKPASAPVESRTAKTDIAPATQVPDAGLLKQGELDSVVATAVTHWDKTGLSKDQIATLRKLQFEVADLPDLRLGEADGNRIRVDNNAGGSGWFIDVKGDSDALFAKASGTRSYTNSSSTPAGRIDLLTAIMHEMGHALGLDDSYLEKDRDSLMYGYLTKGERRLPKKDQAKGVTPPLGAEMHFLSSTLNIGALPAGKSVVITYVVTIKNPVPGGTTQIVSQGTVTADGGISVLTDDPTPGGATDPTTTPLAVPPTSYGTFGGPPPDKATVGFAYAGYTFNANGNPAPTYTLAPGSGPLPGGFSLNSATGALTAANPSASGTFSNIIVRATNVAGVLDTAPFTITVAPAIAFTTNSPLASWTKDFAGYSQTIVTTGGTGAITYSVSVGSLPNGISLDTNSGAITGTPTVVNTFNFTIKATDSLGANTSKAYSITINAAITVSPATLPAGQVNTAYTQTATAAGGTGTKTFGFTGTLPSGLSLSTAGVLSGTPDTPGSYNFTIVATDTVGATGSQAYTVVIKQSTTTALSSSQNPSSNGFAVTFTATVSPVGNPPGIPTGSATFFDGATPITCSENSGTIQTLDGTGKATCTTSTLTVAGSPHSITAQYSGDTKYLASTSSAVSQTVLACTNPVTVTTNTDAGGGSLRQALLDVCDGGAINFAAALNGQTITLTTGELVINKNVTITGPVAAVVTVSGNSASRVLEVQPGKTVAISRLTFTGGSATGGFPAGQGGAIFNDHGVLTVSNCVLSNNSAAGAGGAIFSNGFTSGTASLVVKSCTFTNNTAAEGGALYNYGDTGTATMDVLNSTFSGGNSATGAGGAINNYGAGATGNATLRIVNTTISGNKANGDGGGIYNTNNASAATATTTLTNVTVTNNRADNNTDATGAGGGIRALSGTVSLKNTIVSGNFKGGSPSLVPDDINGAVNADYSLIGNTTGAGITGANNQLNVDPVLGALGNNGGPTQTHLPGSGSIAINNGSNALLPADTFDLDNDANVAETLPVDQRGPGFPRVVNTTVDIGAIEANYVIAVTAGDSQHAIVGTAFTTNLKAKVSESGTSISGVSVTFTAPASGASGTFAGTGTNASNAIVSDASGFVTAPVFTANNTAGGPYDVFASATNFSSADFKLTNDAAPPSPTPTATATSTPTPTATATATATPTATATATATASPTPTATATATPTATASATATATATATPTATATATAKPTATATATPTATPAQSLNISTRVRVDTGDKVMIGGFIIRGNLPKPVVLRGLGPSLVNSGITAGSVLNDPVLELHGSSGALITSNDNWRESPQKSQIEGTVFQPTDDRESVILATLPPAAYTVVLKGAGGTSGIGLVEVYDNNQAVDSDLANISTRGFVLTGNSVMIGGFTLGGNNNPTRMAVRALGPSLTAFGLSNVLADPTLELHNANGTIMVSNDDWQSDAASAALLTANGLALPDPKESGIFTSLAPPGQFTAIVAGKNGGIGIALVEIYNLR